MMPDNTSSKGGETKLAKCKECKAGSAIYSCPRCSLKTCSLECCKKHKVRTGCNGKRDRTSFLPLSRMTDGTLRSDYHFLEDVLNEMPKNKKRAVESHQNVTPTQKRRRLVKQAASREITLQLMPPVMQRHKCNKSFYNAKQDNITWTVEVILIGTKQDTITVQLSESNDDIIASICAETKQAPESFSSHSLFLRRIPTSANKPRYVKLDKHRSLRENLRGQTIIEYPTVFCVPEEAVDGFPCGSDVVEEVA